MEEHTRAPISDPTCEKPYTTVETPCSHPFRKAALDCNLEEIRKQLRGGSDPNYTDERGQTALHIAIGSGNLAFGVVQELLKIESIDVDCRDYNGYTPLHAAVSRRSTISIITLLLDSGADVNCQDNLRRTPLHDAAREGDLPTTKILLDRGADVNCRDINGYTPLRNAIGYDAVVKLLLERGANADCQDNDGCTPFHSAAYRGSMSSATLSGEESSKSKTRNRTVSSAFLFEDSMDETSSSSSESCIALGLRFGDENEYDEGGSGDDSDYNIEISHNLKGTGTYRCHGGSRSDSKGKWKPVSTKRSLSQSHRNRSNDQDDESFDQPSKRRKGLKAQVGSPSQTKRPFSCPYFKKDPFKYFDCAHWNDTNLRQVKEHCKSWHLKLWCHRCKEFQANTQNVVDRHSRYDNCQMNEETPGSAYSRNDTNSEIRNELDYPRTCTWERVFKVLFHRNTPDPYWNQPADKAVQAYNGELSTKIRRFLPIPSDRQSEYQLGLANNLKDRLGLDGDDVENVMVAFNEDWTAKDCNQVQISNIDGSESGSHDAAASVVISETQSCITPEQIPNITSFNDELQPTTAIVQDQQSQPNEPDPPVQQAEKGRDPSFIPLCGSHSEPVAAITTVQCYVGDFPNVSGPLGMFLEAPAEEWDVFCGLSPTPTHDGLDFTTYTHQRNIPS